MMVLVVVVVVVDQLYAKSTTKARSPSKNSYTSKAKKKQIKE